MKNNIIQEQIDWIKSGKIGCVFASALVKQREKIGWHFVYIDTDLNKINIWHYIQKYAKDTFIASLVFPDTWTITDVRNWALNNGMYIEDIGDMYEGLRIKMNEGVSWVQYFGPDSPVKTRQSPHPMLTFTVKLPAHIYAKTMVKGIYHLAHASIEFFTAKQANTLWERSFAKTKKELGFKPTLREAAKTTFIK